jgi:hypothetical protein
MITLLLLALQTATWTVAPNQLTVGDTIRIERTITAPPGWRVRAGKFPAGSVTEPLTDASVLATSTPGQWLVRYGVVAWSPGPITLDMPPLWRLGPDGTADSIPGGTATFRVASVIPDSVKSPAPQPSLGLLRLEHRGVIPVGLAVVLAAGALGALIAWRRRAPHSLRAASGPDVGPEIADERWLTAGEPKAVAARATYYLRTSVARAIPAAHEALSTSECLAVVERAQPSAPLRELRELLGALDQIAFATAHGVDVAAVARRARALARELGANGTR